MSALTSPEPPSLKAVESYTKALEKDFVRASKYMVFLKALDRRMKPVRITAKLGQFSKEIYEKDPVTQHDIVSRLPAEIQAMVWRYLDTDADRIAVALTCKFHAQQFENLKHLQKVRQSPHPSPRHRLMVLIRLLRWMPSEYRLCFTCIRFIKTTGHWSGDRRFLNDAIALDSGNPWHSAHRAISLKSNIPQHAEIKGPRCSICTTRAGNDQIKHKQVHADTMELLSIFEA